MNYEAKVADLSGAPRVAEDVEFEPARSRRRRIIIGAGIVLALLAGGALLLYGGGEEAPFQSQAGEQVPTVSGGSPGQTAVQGEMSATGTLAARRPLPVVVVREGGRVVPGRAEPCDWGRAGQPLRVI